MSEEYPFSLSKSTVERLRSRSQVELARWLERLNLPPASSDPTRPLIIETFDDWLLHLSSYVRALRWVADEALEVFSLSEEHTGLYYTLDSIVASVEAEAERFDNLLTWGSAAWQDDPVMRRHFQGQMKWEPIE